MAQKKSPDFGLCVGGGGQYRRVHTEWQRPLPGVHSIMMMEKLAKLVSVGVHGCTPHPPFTIVTITGRQLPPLSSILYGIISKRPSVLPAQLLLREKSAA